MAMLLAGLSGLDPMPPPPVPGAPAGAPSVTAGRGAGHALLALAVLLAAVAAWSAWSGASRLAGRGDAGTARAVPEAAAVEAAATAFVAAYGAFDHREPDAYTARLAGLAAGELRSALQGAAVDPAAVASRLASTAVAQSVSVTELSAFSAEAAVRALHRRGRLDPAGGELVHEVVTQHVRLLLAREGGRWLVTEVRVLSEEQAGAWGAGREGRR